MYLYNKLYYSFNISYFYTDTTCYKAGYGNIVNVRRTVLSQHAKSATWCSEQEVQRPA